VTARIFAKLFLAVLCVFVIAVLAVDVLASRDAAASYRQTLERELAEKGRMLAALIPRDSQGLTRQRAEQLAEYSGARLTIVARDGRVLADSDADAEHMENHRARPEIARALGGNVGASTRVSPTVGVEFLYVAVPAPQGAIRLAVPTSSMRAHVDGIRLQLLYSTALAFLPAIILAALFSRYVSSRLGAIIDYAGKLAEGNFSARLADPGTDELGILGGKLNETGEKLQGLRETLLREEQELEKLERVRKDFVINVSHELRTPLASIQGYTETLLDGAIHDPDHNLRFLNIIRQNAERLTKLASDLLTLSGVELKTEKFQFASYRLNTLMQDCVDAMQPLAEKRGQSLGVEKAEAGAEVFCDWKAVHQALGNLLENALKYSPEGGSVTVGARAAKRENFVEIYVRDTGHGIPADELPRLFERFYRVDKARSRELGGTGLGLAIVKHLALAHGGEARVESEVGVGSTFSISLPVHDPALAGAAVTDS
jgi:two-component system phosphate regulon sensor histidine kinase PhoR